jgi:CheY-like chemotaxis protein/bifunctional DNA-binding transcriptional regulator/antitoxin component of YhaV-PrlF toxin-antitoxin module
MENLLVLVVLFLLVHFNSKTDNILEKLNKSVNSHNFHSVDALKVDDHSRITFTKRVRNVLPIQTGDSIAVYQNKKNRNVVFNIEREGSIVDTWICRRVLDDLNYDNDTIDVIYGDSKNDNNTRNINPAEAYPEVGQILPSATAPHGLRGETINQSATYGSTKKGELNTINDKSKIKSANKIIMIVDDERDTLTTLKLLLAEIDVNVETFSSSQDAIIHFAQGDPSTYDLIILDIKMPVISGLKLYAMMHSLGVLSSKFLFMSDLDYAEEFIQTLPEMKKSNFIKKPIEGKTLLQQVKESLNYYNSFES